MRGGANSMKMTQFETIREENTILGHTVRRERIEKKKKKEDTGLERKRGQYFLCTMNF